MKKFLRPLIVSTAACGLLVSLNSCDQMHERKEEHKEAKEEKAAEKPVEKAAEKPAGQ